MERRFNVYRKQNHCRYGESNDIGAYARRMWLADILDSILIIPGENGASGTLYQAVLSGNEWELKTETLASIPSGSKLVISSEHINRLRSATVYVIVSTQSGAGLAVTAFDNLLEPLLKQFDIPFSVHKTISKTSHREFLKSITFSPDQENVVVIFGGDTMIYDLLNSVPNNHNLSSTQSLTICPIPCGTGNALAMSLGTTSIPIGITKALGISKTSAQPLPILKVTIRERDAEQVFWGAVVCSWGLHASLVADSDDPEMRREYGVNRFTVSSRLYRSNDRSPHNAYCLLRLMSITVNYGLMMLLLKEVNTLIF